MTLEDSMTIPKLQNCIFWTNNALWACLNCHLPKGGSTGFIRRNFSAQVSMAKSVPHILIALYSSNLEQKFWEIFQRQYYKVRIENKNLYYLMITFLWLKQVRRLIITMPNATGPKYCDKISCQRIILRKQRIILKNSKI